MKEGGAYVYNVKVTAEGAVAMAEAAAQALAGAAPEQEEFAAIEVTGG